MKADIINLSEQAFEALFALALYQQAAELLRNESVRSMRALKEEAEDDKYAAFITSVRHWHNLWVASVYIVHEGLVGLDVQDATLDRIRAKGDLAILRCFRNATFHFQPKWRDDRHTALIMGDMTGWVEDLHRRHDQLITKMVGLGTRHHRLKDKIL